MKIVIFGLSISSSWGNGHATLWRGLCKALARRQHRVVFFERDVPYYAAHRDLREIAGGSLVLYAEWDGAVIRRAQVELAGADVGIVTSYCCEGIAAADLVCSSACVSIFYDLDTPVTLQQVRTGETVPYIGERCLKDFDLVLSYTGGAALAELKTRLLARRVAPLYGSVDPDLHRPAPPNRRYRSDLSYLGTYAKDRQAALEALFVEPARRLPGNKFLIGGALYPYSFPWRENIFFTRHLPPAEHPAFFSSSRLTLNVTRQAMASMGYCPSGRLFEAAACGAPILSDQWDGLDRFFEPGREILLARTTEDAINALEQPPERLEKLARAARERTLDQHTADHRAREFEAILDAVRTDASRDGAAHAAGA